MKKDDELVFQIIFEKNCHALFRYISCRISGDREMAKDLLDDVWEVLIIHFDEVSEWEEKEVTGWLFGVAKNKVNNYFRRKYHQMEIPTAQEKLAGLVAELPEITLEERIEMWEYIENLKPMEQQLLLMRLCGISYRELSLFYDRSEQALQCLYSRTIKKLKQMMHEQKTSPGFLM